MLTPTDLLEIERKARAYQAEEAENPEAKTCQRPTPELVLRLVDACRELHSKVRLYEETMVVANGKLIAERDGLRAKVAELEAKSASMLDYTCKTLKSEQKAEARMRELEEALKGSCAEIAKYAAESGRLQAIADRVFCVIYCGDSDSETYRKNTIVFYMTKDEAQKHADQLVKVGFKNHGVRVAGLAEALKAREAALAAQAQKGGDK